MAEPRTDIESGGVPAKRQKMSNGNVDPRSNPYLAHMYEEPDANGYGNGYSTPPRRVHANLATGPLAKFQRHKTTAALAKSVEDGESNPFTGETFSQRYVSILRTRRNLPVHAQR